MAYGGAQRQGVQQCRGVEFGAKHRGHVGVGHFGQGDWGAGVGGQIDALQRWKVSTEPVEQRCHRGRIGGVGGDLDQGHLAGGQLLAALVESAAMAGHRDDGACAHPGELGDQVRTDLAAGADDQLAAVGVEHHTGSRGLGGVAL